MIKLTSVQQNFRTNYLVPRGWKAPAQSQKPGLLTRIGNWFNLGPSLVTPNGITMRPTDLGPNNLSTMLSSSATFTPSSRRATGGDPERVLNYLGDLRLSGEYIFFTWQGSQFVNIELRNSQEDESLCDYSGVSEGEDVEFNLGSELTHFELVVRDYKEDAEIGKMTFDFIRGQLQIAFVQGFDAEQKVAQADDDVQVRVRSAKEEVSDNEAEERLTAFVQELEGFSETRGAGTENLGFSFTWNGPDRRYLVISHTDTPKKYFESVTLIPGDFHEIVLDANKYYAGGTYLVQIAGEEGKPYVGSFVITPDEDGNLAISQINGFEAEDTPKILSFGNGDIRAVEARGNEVEIAWKPVPGANAYEIKYAGYRYDLDRARPTIVKDTRHIFRGFYERSTYYYQITPLQLDEDEQEVARGGAVSGQFYSGEKPRVRVTSSSVTQVTPDSIALMVELPSRTSCLCRLFSSREAANRSNPSHGSGSIALAEERMPVGRMVSFRNLRPGTEYFVALHPSDASGDFGVLSVVEARTEDIILEGVNPASISVSPSTASAYIVWPAVHQANAYEVQVLRSSPHSPVGGTKIVTENAITLSGLEPGTVYLATIRPLVKGAGIAGPWQATNAFTTKKLETPSFIDDPVFTETEERVRVNITWTAVSTDVSYRVRINGQEPVGARSNNYSFVMQGGKKFTFQVQAIVTTSNGEMFESPWTLDKEFETPKTKKQIADEARRAGKTQRAAAREAAAAEEAVARQRQKDEALKARQRQDRANRQKKLAKKRDEALKLALSALKFYSRGWTRVGKAINKIKAAFEWVQKNNDKLAYDNELARMIIDAIVNDPAMKLDDRGKEEVKREIWAFLRTCSR